MGLLALRLLWRELRSGKLGSMLLALLLAVTAQTVLERLLARADAALSARSAELLGADLVLESPTPLPESWPAQAATRGIHLTATVEFPTVVSHGEHILLVSALAVPAHYPLRGALVSAEPTDHSGGERLRRGRQGPPAGEVWVHERVLNEMGLVLGENLQLGAITLCATRILRFEPGRGGGMMSSLLPRVLLSKQDLAAAAVVQEGSRVEYRTLLAGPAAALADLQAQWTPRLDPGQEWLRPRSGRGPVSPLFARAEHYLQSVGLLAAVLAGAAVVMAARRFRGERWSFMALARAFGVSQRKLAGLLLWQLGILGMVAIVLGLAAGLLADAIATAVAAHSLRAPLPPIGSAGLWPAAAVGMVLLLAFALPELWALRRVPAVLILRRTASGTAWPRSGAVLLGLVALLALFAWRTGEPMLVAILLGGAAALAICIAALAWLALKPLARTGRLSGSGWRLGIKRLARRRRAAPAETAALALVLMTGALVVVLRADLFAGLQTKLAADAPNYFAINIPTDGAADFAGMLQAHGVRGAQLYPVVRARLAVIDGVPAQQAAPETGQGHNALRRELNLTTSVVLPTDNALVDGRWWQGVPGEVSVEVELAQSLGIRTGAVLEFEGADERFRAQVTSLRSVQWESLQPNFYFIFSPGTLAGQPARYMTSFHLESAQTPLLRALVTHFPAVTVFDVQALLDLARDFADRLAAVLEYLLVFMLLGSLTVLWATSALQQPERRYEGALLRALGGATATLRSAYLAEFAALGALAGLCAAAGTELASATLNAQVFGLPVRLHPPLWLVLPVLGLLLTVLVGLPTLRDTTRVPPAVLLRA